MVRTGVVLGGLFIPVFSVWATVWNIPGDFVTVQAALDAPDPGHPSEHWIQSGDTLMLAPGSYPGFNLYWQSDMTVCSSHGRDVTFIDGQNTADTGIRVSRPNCSFEGLTIRNFRDEGICVLGEGNRLRNLCVVNNGNGPDSLDSIGIGLYRANIEVSDVIVRNSPVGVYFNCLSADQCSLINTNVTDCYHGIDIMGHANLVEKVTVSGCTYGITMQADGYCNTLNNIVRKCTIKNNKLAGFNMGRPDIYGIEYSNAVYDNYFSGNPVNIDASQGAMSTQWNIEKTPGQNIVGGAFLGGNYWDDYYGSDLDQDGLGDTDLPYGSGIRDGGPDGSGYYYSGDYHPLIQRVSDLSIAVEDLTIPGPMDIPLTAAAEQTAEVRATVRNLGAVPAEDIEIVLYAYGFQAASTVLESLPVGGSTSVTFTWDVIDTIRYHMRGLEAEFHGTLNAVWAAPRVELKVSADPHEHIPDVNPSNNSAAKSVLLRIVPDIELTEVIPIQVVRDVPLIINKPMMTRVNMRLAESCRDIFSVVHGVRVRVLFDDGNLSQETPFAPVMSLVGKAGTGYIVPRDKVNMFKNLMNNEALLKEHLFKFGWDAFNLEYSSSSDTTPRREGAFTIQAQLVTLDASESGNTVCATATGKKSIHHEYRILYMPLDSLSTDHTETLAKHVEMAHNHAAFLEAIYPVPRVREYYGYSRVNNKGRPLDPPTVHGFWVGERARVARKATLISWFDWVDTVVWVVPSLALGMGIAGTAQPQAGIGVFVDETQGFPMHVSAHEIGHTWGLAGMRGHTEEYDDDNNILALYPAGNGWDVMGRASYRMKSESNAKYSYYPEDPTHLYTYQTHMGDHRIQRPWVTEANYRRLMDGMWPWGGLVNGGSDPRMLFVSGEIQEDGTTELWPFFTRNGMEMTPEAGAYSFDCEAEGGAILSRTSFDPCFENNGENHCACFSFPIPFPEGTVNVLLRHEGTVLARRSVSATPPILDLGSVLEAGHDWFEMACTANDADGDEMEYLTAYSNDGSTWMPLESSFAKKRNGKSAFTFDSLPLPGGNACTVKVVASDGINTVEEVSAPFLVPKKTPSVIIGDPDSGAAYHERDTVFFNGFGYDAEDGNVESASYVWTSSRDGELARSREGFSTSSLSIGEHTITLHVQDSDGNPAESTVTIQVEPGYTDSDTDTLPDWWEKENFESLGLTAEDDPDGDLYSNAEEYAQGTDPNVSDTEGEEEGAEEGEGTQEGEGEGAAEGEGVAEGMGEGENEGEGEEEEEGVNEGEGEGEGPNPPCGCNKTEGAPVKTNKRFDDLLLLMCSGVVLILFGKTRGRY